MNLRDLKYLVAVDDTRHFGHAAERCFVSQPTLSGQIKKLEEELGVTLFERTKRSVETTHLGEAIVEQARNVLEQADALQQLAQSHQDPLLGTLRMRACPDLKSLSHAIDTATAETAISADATSVIRRAD